MKIKISPARLVEGGAAMLNTLNKNHHKANKGIMVKLPRVNKILRVDNRR
jgi:hypothetical protein